MTVRLSNDQLKEKSHQLDQMGQQLEGKNPLTNITAFSQAAKLQTEIVQELVRRELDWAKHHG